MNQRHLEYARSYQDSDTGETEAGSSISLPQKVNIECMVQSSFFLPRKKLRAGSFFTILWCCPKGRDNGEWMPLIFLPTLIWLISHLLGVQGSLKFLTRGVGPLIIFKLVYPWEKGEPGSFYSTILLSSSPICMPFISVLVDRAVSWHG